MATPLGPDAFARLMAPLGPWERRPVLAVAVSGGPDSMALGALADGWARGHGGRVEALVVDHGLRPDSAAEARRVAGWLAERDVAATVLRREGPRPTADVQAAARAARYRLLGEWCRAAGIVHLLLAHHRDDQAETVLLRLGRGSGLDGLAAMAAVVELAGVRLVRPLLAVPRARLAATVAAHGLPAVDDPSNRDPRFARARVRALAPALAAEGVTAARLAAAAAGLGRARAALEAAAAAFLARAAALHPAGFCRLDPAAYRAAEPEVARRALARIVQCLGGHDHPPRAARLERLHAALAGDRLGGGRTLGGCRFVARRGGVLVCREPAAAAETTPLLPDAAAHWDGRFEVRGPARGEAREVRRLGRDGWRRIAAAAPALRKSPIPGAARPALPAIYDLDGVVAVPHVGYVREGLDGTFRAVFRPRQPLCPPAFAFASSDG